MRGGGRQQILPAGSEDARLVGVELPLFEVKLRLIELLLVRVVLRNHNNNNNSNSNTSASCTVSTHASVFDADASGSTSRTQTRTPRQTHAVAGGRTCWLQL